MIQGLEAKTLEELKR